MDGAYLVVYLDLSHGVCRHLCRLHGDDPPDGLAVGPVLRHYGGHPVTRRPPLDRQVLHLVKLNRLGLNHRATYNHENA